jgi:hypothetical protein
LRDSEQPVFEVVGLSDLSVLNGLDSMARILKLLPVCATPKNSPEGVPVTSPRTTTRFPETNTSLMLNLMSGTVFAKLAMVLIDCALPQQAPATSSGFQQVL